MVDNVESTVFDRDELKEIREAFDLFDTDASGTIDVKELRQAVEALGFKGSSSYALLSQIDTDQSGVIEFPEFVGLVERKLVWIIKFFYCSPLFELTTNFSSFFFQADSDTRSNARQVFAMFDLEGKGYIDSADLTAIADDIGQVLSQNDALDIIKRTNTKGDGRVTFEEFYSVYSRKKFHVSL